MGFVARGPGLHHLLLCVDFLKLFNYSGFLINYLTSLELVLIH